MIDITPGIFLQMTLGCPDCATHNIIFNIFTIFVL